MGVIRGVGVRPVSGVRACVCAAPPRAAGSNLTGPAEAECERATALRGD